MSCWMKQSSAVLTDCKKDLLEKALNSLGFALDHNQKTVRNAWGSSDCDAALVKQGRTMPLGIAYTEEDNKTKATLVGDFWGTGVNESNFINEMSVAYSKESIKQYCDENGYTIDVDQVDDNGEIVMQAWQYA